MLKPEENDLLTQVGPGTPGGELLRRYWQPVAAVQELDVSPTKPVRLLGEDFVLYKDLDGAYGLLDEQCPHRGASLVYGTPESPGIRCPYHGWRFDGTGTCLEQPNEFRYYPKFRELGATRGFPVRTMGGLIFAYLGPQPQPELPPFHVWASDHPNALVDIGAAVVPCNWLQIQENSLDPTHAEWLHGRYFDYLLRQMGEPPTTLSGHHVRIAFDAFEYGIIKRRLREGQSEASDDWQVGHPVLFPNILFVGGRGLESFQIRVPIDDCNTWHVWYSVYELSPENAPLLGRMRRRGEYFDVPVRDEKTGRFRVDTIDGQDMMVWATQGRIANRTREKIGGSDRGIVLYRQMLKQQIEAVEQGRDPIGVFREPNPEIVRFHIEQKPLGSGEFTDNEMRGYLRLHAKFSPAVNELVQLIDAQLESQGQPALSTYSPN